jgi:transposase
VTHEQALDAEERDKIRIHLALEQGITTRELEEELQVPQQTISRWGRQGKEALERREGVRKARESAGDHHPGETPVRSGEPEPVG